MKEKMLGFIGMVSYVSLPLMLTKSFLLFLIGVCISATVVYISYDRDKKESQIFKLLIWSACFSGLGIGGLKILDAIVIVLTVIIVTKRSYVLKSRQIIAILPFYIFIVLQTVLMNALGKSQSEDVLIELGRYLLAFLLLFLVTQLRLGESLNSDVKWLDKFAVLEIVQTMIMLKLQKIGIVSLSYSLGPINMVTFDTTTESRGTAFFTDPNKLMSFFLILLCVRVLFSSDGLKSTVNWHWKNIIYLFGALITFARTSVISITLILACFLIFNIHDVSNRKEDKHYIRYVLLFLTISLVGVVFLNFKGTIVANVENAFTKILGIFGRNETATLDTSFGTDGRVQVWKMAVPEIFNNIFLGHGLLSEQRLLPIPTHNTFLQMLLDGGLFGFLLYYVGILKITLSKIPFWLFISSIGITMLFLDLGNFRLLYIFMGICCNQRFSRSASNDKYYNSLI